MKRAALFSICSFLVGLVAWWLSTVFIAVAIKHGAPHSLTSYWLAGPDLAALLSAFAMNVVLLRTIGLGSSKKGVLTLAAISSIAAVFLAAYAIPFLLGYEVIYSMRPLPHWGFYIG